MKTCTKCGIEKDESEFSKNISRLDGYNVWCKKCFEIYRNNPINKEKKRLIEIEYRKKDSYKEKYKERRKTEKYKDYMKEYNLNYRNIPENATKEKLRKKTEKYKNKASEHRSSDEFKEKRKQYRKLDYVKNKEKSYAFVYNRSDKHRKSYIKRNFEMWNGFPPPQELVEVKLLINKTKRLCKTLKN